MTKLVKKDFSNEELRKIFIEIKNARRKSLDGEKFVLDLDLVWPLLYTHKHNAVKYVLANYIKSVDYQHLNQTVDTHHKNVDQYMLSVFCFEHLLSVKNKDVFRVYSEFLHENTDDKMNQKLPSKFLEVLNSKLGQVLDTFKGILTRLDRLESQSALGSSSISQAPLLALQPSYEPGHTTTALIKTYFPNYQRPSSKHPNLSATSVHKEMHRLGQIFVQKGHIILLNQDLSEDLVARGKVDITHNDGLKSQQHSDKWSLSSGKELVIAFILDNFEGASDYYRSRY